MYGRFAAGVRSTASTHHPAPTTTATPAASSCHTRRPSPVGAATRYASASAGSTVNGCNPLARKENPMTSPASSSQRVDAFSSARVAQ